jgi:hypothetical protein
VLMLTQTRGFVLRLLLLLQRRPFLLRFRCPFDLQPLSYLRELCYDANNPSNMLGLAVPDGT